MNPLQPGIEALGGWDGSSPRTLKVTVEGVPIAVAQIRSFRVAHGVGACQEPTCDCCERHFILVEAEEVTDG